MRKLLLSASLFLVASSTQSMAEPQAKLIFNITPSLGSQASIDISSGGTAKPFKGGTTKHMPAGDYMLMGTIYEEGSSLQCPSDGVIKKHFEGGKTYFLTLTPSKTPEENCHLSIEP